MKTVSSPCHHGHVNNAATKVPTTFPVFPGAHIQGPVHDQCPNPSGLQLRAIYLVCPGSMEDLPVWRDRNSPKCMPVLNEEAADLQPWRSSLQWRNEQSAMVLFKDSAKSEVKFPRAYCTPLRRNVRRNLTTTLYSSCIKSVELQEWVIRKQRLWKQDTRAETSYETTSIS